MNIQAIALLISAIGATAGLAAQSGVLSKAPTELAAYLARFTGDAPVDCGFHAIAGFGTPPAGTEQLGPSLQCAREATAAARPFVAVKQDQGIDSLIFQGLVGTVDGVTYRFEYDSQPCGGPGCPGRFTVERCPKPMLATQRAGSSSRAMFACAR
jgi:hypothetical protein